MTDTVVFDAEALVAFAFGEPGADAVQGYLDEVYDGTLDGRVPTVNLAELRYVGLRRTSAAAVDSHISSLERMGLSTYGVDGLWEAASGLKATYGPSLADAYAVAAAEAAAETGDDVTLLVGADDDYDVFEDADEFDHRIERFRNKPA